MMLCRHGTQDGLAVQEVLDQNEYRLPERLEADDVIVDVGAHIGSFAAACLERGGRRIHCYEPIADNLELLKINVKSQEDPRGVVIHPNAVWHTAGPLFLKAMGTPYTAMFSACLPDGIHAAMAVTLDHVLEPFEKVRLLKLDCEGAEVPILESVSQAAIGKVLEIVGEVHLNLMAPGYCRPTIDWVKGILATLGFDDVQVRRNPRAATALAMFWGRRK